MPNLTLPRSLLLALALLAAGCADSPAPPADGAPPPDMPRVDLAAPDGASPADTLADQSPFDLSALDAVPDAVAVEAGTDAQLPPPPSAYDCTSVAAGPPARTTTVPLGCIIDPSCTTTLVCAHRGAGVDSQELFAPFYLPIGQFAPENTLLAIRWAIVIGADEVEVDVQTTQDGHLVLMHDDDVARTTFGQGKVSDLTLAQLQALKLKTGQFPGDFSCAKVTTFDEALALAKGRINVNVDTKTPDGDKVALAIQQAGMLDQAFVSTSSLAKLAMARQAVPAVRLHARTDDASQIPTILAAFTPPINILEIDEKILTPANIATIHAAGVKAFVDGFTYDVQGYMTSDPNAYAPLVAKSPDVIQVDRSDLLLKLLGR
jgi:glycerophosphoryl diester phosphodiesterase